MKKLIFTMVIAFLAIALNAQSLADIVTKQSQALKEDKYDNVKTLKVTGKMSQMGMDLTMTTWFKAPNKIRVVLSVSGMEITQVFDGEKGYMINPMSGSDAPQELPASQVETMKNNSSFKSPLSQYFKNGKLTLEGSENVKDKPAFKMKAVDGENVYYIYVDKASYLPVKTSVTTSGITVDSYQEWSEINGLMLPAKTTSQAEGMEFVMTFDNVEVNVPIEDSFFKVN